MTTAVSRRRVLTGIAWATPAVVIASAVPSLAASTDPAVQDLFVAAVRADGPAWQGTGTLAPGFRFGNQGTQAHTATLTITRSGVGTPTFGAIMTGYQGLPWNSGTNAYTVATSLTAGTSPGVSAGTVGVTMLAVPAAVGIYTASITLQGHSTPSQVAAFEISRNAQGAYLVSPV